MQLRRSFGFRASRIAFATLLLMVPAGGNAAGPVELAQAGANVPEATKGKRAASEASGSGAGSVAEQRVASVGVRGNRRIEADAIKARATTKAGDPLDRARLAQDVRAIFGLGFFRDVRVLVEDAAGGVNVIFEVQENPVVRQVAISGNEQIDSEKIRDAMTLTTGATLDEPLVFENQQRIEQLYRGEGFYLAKVSHDITSTGPDAVAVNFTVQEGEKLRLREIRFEGNQALDSDELADGLKTKPWRFYSLATQFFDNSGTYSEPIFLQDLRTVEQKYTDRGYLQVDLAEPRVDAEEGGLVVTVDVKEGEQFHVGKLGVSGDETADIVALREKLALKEGEVFNRSFLTKDVESLTTHYTDRGYYLAAVTPGTDLSESEKKVDVDFQVERGALHFVREIEVTGNTTTVDPVIRRELQMVEGQLWSARAIDVSKRRLDGLGYFEEVAFEPKPTDQPGELDLNVRVVEKPTGSISFGAGFSSQDSFVLSGSVAQSNLFGRGFGVSLSADIGGSTDRFFFSFSDSYLFGSSIGFGGTVFLTNVQFNDFEEQRRGIDLNFGHALNEENTARGYLGYSLTNRRVNQDSNFLASAVLFREVVARDVTTSLVSLSARGEQLDNRIVPTDGYQWGGGIEGAGFGGFSQFLRLEARGAYYQPAPKWLIEGSTFAFQARGGWVIPFNTLEDYDLGDTLAKDNPACDTLLCNVGNYETLDNIDTDIELPLTERYFVGGLGTFQLRGYKARSVGPRRAVLYDTSIAGPLTRNARGPFSPVGYDSTDGSCDDPADFPYRQGNGNGKCNDITDKDIKDFEDLEETDVIGGNKFVSLSTEYRFPISQALGLVGILFVDAGGAFAEDQSVFQLGEWRYGTGFGALWFSPFGPLQGFLGFPINPLSVEDNFVFEFSVGGANF